MNLKYILSFTAGAAIGALFAWKITKDKYSKVIEMEEIKEKKTHEEAVNELKGRLPEKPDISDYVKKLEEQRYVPEMPYSEPKKDPYVIPPEDFSMFTDYATETLTFYADGYLIDSNDDELNKEEIEKYIGMDALNHFGEYDDDVVYVRNDEMERDFEIILEDSNWKDIPNPEPVTIKDEEEE